MSKFPSDSLLVELDDAEFAHSYIEEHLILKIAAQIRALRLSRGWSQVQLAKASGMAQERISKLESADFESITMATLNKLARAFDVSLAIKFESFQSALNELPLLSVDYLSCDARLTSLEKMRAVPVTATYLTPVKVAAVSTQVFRRPVPSSKNYSLEIS